MNLSRKINTAFQILKKEGAGVLINKTSASLGRMFDKSFEPG